LSFLKAYNPAEDMPHIVVRLSELFAELSNAKTLRPNTISCYSIAVNRLRALCGDKRLDEFKSEDLARFKQELLNNGVSQTSVNIWIRSLAAVFSYGVRQGYITKNPFSLSLTIKIAKQPPVFMSQEEFEKLLNVVQSKTLRDFFTVAGNTGMRLSEILNLKWTNISLDKKQIAVVNSDEFTTKSGKSRIVPMNDRVFEVFAKRNAEQSDNGYVFCKSNGYKFQRNYVSHAFKKCVRRAKLNEKYHCHTLRHSFASWLALKEVPIFSIQQLLGHASVNTTLQYAHLSSSVLHSAVNKL
jgi:site-specific recombinase XerD